MTQQGLSAGNAYASSERHSGIGRVYGNADHTHCPSLAQNYIGYTSSPRGGDNRTAIGPCGAGFTEWYPSGTANILFRGAEYNPNSSTYDFIYYADYDW